MKALYLLLLIIVLGSCNQNLNQKSEDNSEATEQQVENQIDKYLGYWKRADGSEEVLRIFANQNIYYVSDGEKEIPVEYDSKENKFTIHRPDADNEIIYSEQDNQLHWIVKEFGETTGRVVWKYNFLKK